MPIISKPAGGNPKVRNQKEKTVSSKKKEEVIKTKKEGNKPKKDEDDIINWYVNNDIDKKKKKNVENVKSEHNNEDNGEDSEYEDIKIAKNVEEYISVVCRIKNDVKQNESTLAGDLDVVKKVNDQKLIIDTMQIGIKESAHFEYTYDRVYDINNNNHYIFNDFIKHYIKNVFQGVNCSVLAYGQTNSGKTYTMLGNFDFINNLYKLCFDNKENKITNNSFALTYEELINCICNEPHNVGIVPACINYIFNYINYQKNKNKNKNNIKEDIKEFKVTLSIIEIYNEVIYDLISGKSNLVVQTVDVNKNESVIKNMEEVEIDNIITALCYLEKGVKNRKMAFTNMNKTSSRSHLIFIIKINRFIPSTNVIKCGKLCLVDLAGSERLKQTKATGSVKIEATMINKSLTVLSKVINALAVMQMKEKLKKTDVVKEDLLKNKNEETEIEKHEKTDEEKKAEENVEENVENKTKKENKKEKIDYAKHIPYRDSKLTRVLSDSLGNNCKSVLICTLAAQMKYINETASTIKFAQRAKMVKAKPIVREEKVEIKTEEENEKEKKKKGKDGRYSKNGTKEETTDENHILGLDGEETKHSIYFNFNPNNIMKRDLILFCFQLCIFSYLCGYISTGKVKYLDFFIESYKNKIEIMKQQIENKNKDNESNTVNEYLRKTFDDLKVLTEEERAQYDKINKKNMELLAKEKAGNQKKKKKENEKIKGIEPKIGENDADSKDANKDNSVDEKIGNEQEIKKEKKDKKEEKSKLTLEYLNKFNEKYSHQKKQQNYMDSDNMQDDLSRTHLSKGDDDEDDEDTLIGDILIKMKNDICSILKFNFNTLKNRNFQKDKQNEKSDFDEIISIVNEVKENNNIFLVNELKASNEENNEKPDHGKTEEIEKKEKYIKENKNAKEDYQKGEQEEEKEKEKEKEEDNGKTVKGGKISKTTKNLKEKLLRKQGNKVDDQKRESKLINVSPDKISKNQEQDKKQEEENETTEDSLNHASQVLSIKNIKNIFEYVNNNFCRFISDFTTDNSDDFSDFDLNENIDKDTFQKRETIYNFIHASTMFHNLNTLKPLASNFFYNKLHSEFQGNFQTEQNTHFSKNVSSMACVPTDNKKKIGSKIGIDANTDANTDANGADVIGEKKETGKKEVNELEEKQQTIKIENIIESAVPDSAAETSKKGQKKVRISYQTQNIENKEGQEETCNNTDTSNHQGNISVTQINTAMKAPTINVYQNKEIENLSKLMENTEFTKLYNYLTTLEKRDENKKEKELNTNNIYTSGAILELENKLTEEINKINEAITVDIINGVHINNQANSLNHCNEDVILKNQKKNSIENKKDIINTVNYPNDVSKQLKDIELTYLENKRSTRLCIRKIWNKFYKSFQKKNGKASVEEKNINNLNIRKGNILDMGIGKNKMLLKRNLDSYNVRNFYINDKKVYLLNESEYKHLKDLINYKNAIITFLTNGCANA